MSSRGVPSLRDLLNEHSFDLPHRLLDLLPVCVCIYDADGNVLRFNQRAVELWGDPVSASSDRPFGAFRKAGGQYSAATSALKSILESGSSVRDQEVVIEQADGTPRSMLMSIELLKDDKGQVVRALGCFSAHPDRLYRGPDRRSARMERLLAAIVESSEEAIFSEDMHWIIETWNAGSERLFGYSAQEAIGKPATILIPSERISEESGIRDRLLHGEHIARFETTLRRKNESLVPVSLTVSPVKDPEDRIIGVSKIARDITGQIQEQEQKDLLLGEMKHRVKNLLALASSLVALSARTARTPREMADGLRGRLNALAEAVELTRPGLTEVAGNGGQGTTLHSLIRVIVLPFSNEDNPGSRERVTISGPDLEIGANAATSLALVLHEFTTNAAKYGALLSSAGSVEISCSTAQGILELTWTERGGPPIKEQPQSEGFGSVLTRGVMSQLGGQLAREWNPEGMTVRLSVPLARVRV